MRVVLSAVIYTRYFNVRMFYQNIATTEVFVRYIFKSYKLCYAKRTELVEQTDIRGIFS